MTRTDRPMRVRPGRDAEPGGRERGQVLVLLALGLAVLCLAVALAVDGGRMLEERRAAQIAADHAATAAAYSSCLGNDVATARAAGRDSAQENGYDHDAASIDVSVDPVSGQTHTFRATVDSTIPSTFAAVAGITDFDISAEAVAGAEGCDGGGDGPGAIFAGGDSCTGGKYGVDVSGSNNEVYGGVHSNADANVGGGSNDFTETTTPDIPDPWTYVGTLKSGSTGNGNTYEAGYPQDVGPTALPWPDGWAPSDVGFGGTPPPAGSFLRAYYDLADANGTTQSNDTLFTNKVTSITKDGVYYTTHADGMDISSISGSVRNVVLVAPNGPIKISASSKTFNAFQHPSLPREDLLMLSGKTYSGDELCDKFTVAVSGSSSTWNGVLWGPGGLVEMSGSSNTAVNGSLVGWAVRLNGSDLVIRNEGSGGPGDPIVLIRE